MSEQCQMIWVPDAEEVFVKGQLVSTKTIKNKQNKDEKVCLVRVNGKEREVLEVETAAVNPSTFDKIDDMSELTHLNEASVLYNLENRYKDDMIYTYSGLFLVALNPYSNIKVYTQDYVNLYHGSPKEDNEPHIFAVAEQAYRNLLTQRQDQSVLVTGESGAGKTENTKKILQYLASITSDEKLAHTNLESFERKILQANPILESFGNAQTVRNNNSSRFGKFIKIEFDEFGKINGAHIEWYLLEKSRIIQQNIRERNYHVFYQLLSGMPAGKLKTLELVSNSITDYAYLRDSNPSIPGVDDAHDFSSLLSAFNVVGFKEDEIHDIFQCIAIILHIGNVEFTSTRAEQATIKNDVAPLCKLIGVDEAAFKMAVLKPKSKAGKEWVSQSKNAAQSRFILNSLSRSLYEKLFAHIVRRINRSLDHGSMTENYIGLLDIAGFEIFKDNSFEQLCINYTNEKLQQFFNHHMFVLEQREYVKEDIQWDFIDYGKDLEYTIELIEKKNNPAGILSILDEESILPKSTDESFYSKLMSAWDGKSPKFKRSKLQQCFVLEHYAADVEYNVKDWLSKNKDPLNDHLLTLLSESSNKLISEFYTEQSRGHFSKTASNRHKEQLTLLLDQLSSTDPHFVRCIVPNTKKKAKTFDRKLILDQLRCNGVLEGIRIAREGYPNRIFFREFFQRYKILGADPKFSNNSKKNCEYLLSCISLDPSLYKVGNTKLFFKAGVLAQLETQKEEKISGIVTGLNAIIHGKTVRTAINLQFQKLQAAKVLSTTFNLYSKLMEDPWYSLYVKVKPMLGSSQFIAKSKKIAEQVKQLEKDLSATKSERDDLATKNFNVEKELAEIRTALSKETEKLQNFERLYDTAKKREEELRSAYEEAVKLKDTLQSETTINNEEYQKLQKELQQLKESREQSNTKIKELETEKSNLQKQIDSMKRQVDSSTKQAMAMKADKSDLESQLRKLKLELKSKEKRVKELEQKVDNSGEDLKLKLQQVERAAATNNKRLEQLTSENKLMKDQMEKSKKEQHESQRQLSSRGSELIRLNERIEAEREQVSDLTRERDNLVAEHEQVVNQLAIARSEIAEYKKKIEALKAEAENMKENYAESSPASQALVATVENRMRGLEDELTKERAMNRFLNEKLLSAFHNGGVHDAQYKESATKEDLIACYEEAKLKLRKTAFRLEKELEEKKELISRLRFTETRLASASFDNQTICMQLKKLKELLRKSNKNINMEKELEEVDIIEFNHEKLLLEIDYLKRQLEHERNARVNAEHVASSLHSKFRQIQRSDSIPDIYKLKYEASEERVRALESKLMSSPLKDKTNTSNGEIFLHRESISKYEDELKLHKLENYKLQDYLKESNKQLSTLTHELKVAKMAETAMHDQLVQLEQDLASTEKQKQLLQSSVRHHQTQYENCINDLHATEAQMRDLVHSLKQSEEDIQTMTDLIQKLRSQSKQKDMLIWDLEKTIGQLEGKLGDRTRAESELKKELTTLTYKGNVLRAETASKIDDLLQQSTHYDAIIQDLVSQKEAAESLQTALQNKLNALTSQMDNMAKDLNSLATEKLQLENDREMLLSKLKTTNVDFEKSINERTNIVNELEFLREQMVLQQRQNERNESLIEQIQEEALRIKSQLNDERNKNIELYEQNQSLGRTNMQLGQRLEMLEGGLADGSEKRVWMKRIHELEMRLNEESELKFEEMKRNQGLQRMLEELKSATNNQENIISIASKDRDVVEKQFAEVASRVDGMEKYISKQDGAFKKMEQENTYYKNRIAELEQEIFLWQERYKGLSTHRRSLAQSTEEVLI
ncbi:ACR068Wp [Eremothecium gossypii ATCC 10895]|uniref:ACR068Wp n=1 Tax=Eremothecium gossypii (strain ATCC 10895 / CBS 109.51 / FGSC 9923 / NRRL Y-1056) TaxID=284811 RepID=Q75C49_EREGS|nr:ACR068Wp [Eremothecium gossypii ATCC 10895]AAS51294.2 ACR068Wp [Eremothecium gossypii ATCC 10895]AEY95586.1 FACR068Wp [Eremothecium gossypii FDAG1]